MVYFFCTVFGVLNVVTSVFVESALRTTEHYRELMIDEKTRNKVLYARHVSEIFNTIDADGSGMISLEEVEQIFEDPTLSQFIDALEVNATDAKVLFTLLDDDESGEISSEEFVAGCSKLKGEAKSFDVYCLIHEHERGVKVQKRFTESVNESLNAIIKVFGVIDCLEEDMKEVTHMLQAHLGLDKRLSSTKVRSKRDSNDAMVRSFSHDAFAVTPRSEAPVMEGEVQLKHGASVLSRDDPDAGLVDSLSNFFATDPEAVEMRPSPRAGPVPLREITGDSATSSHRTLFVGSLLGERNARDTLDVTEDSPAQPIT